MKLDQQALNLFLYMYALKDDIQGFKTIIKHINLKDDKSINAFKLSFNTACESNSKNVLTYILESPLIEHLKAENFDKATLTASYKKNSDVMCLLLANEKVLETLTYDKKLIFVINQIDNDKAFELTKFLIEKEKYKISEHGDDIFLVAKNRANEDLIEYLFINTLSPGEQLPKNRMYEIILTNQEEIAPIFLSIKEKLNIEFSEQDMEYIRTEKSDLYNLLEKKQLFDQLNEKLKDKDIDKIKKCKI